MKKLTQEEEKMLKRYQRNSISKDGFIIQQARALASTKLMKAIETSFDGHELTSEDHLFLMKLHEKRAKNHETLSASNTMISLFKKMQEKSFEQINIEKTT